MVMVNLVMLAVLGVTGLLVGGADAALGGGRAVGVALVVAARSRCCSAFLHPPCCPPSSAACCGCSAGSWRPSRWRVPAMVRATWWALVTWGLMGLHLWVLLQAFGDVGWRGLLAMVGAMGVGWAVGLVVVVAPAGAGVRDAIVVAVACHLRGRVGGRGRGAGLARHPRRSSTSPWPGPGALVGALLAAGQRVRTSTEVWSG